MLGRRCPPRPVRRRSARLATGGLIVAATLVTVTVGPLAAAGATTPPRGPSAVARAAGNDLSVARLSGLRNYSFSYVVGSPSQEAAVGRVHGTTDWQLTVTVGARTPSVTTYDVGGHGYSQVKGFASIEPVTFATPEGFTHLNGEHTWAQALVDALHVTGVRVTTAGTCRVAGQRGTLYVLKTPTASEGVFSLTDRACVERSGPLLSFAEGVTGGSAAGAIGLTGRSETFTVTSIGRIGVVRAPKGSASAPPSTSAPATSPTVSGRLPAGFPSTVPAPPGTLVSATRLGATKWYVLLTEPSAHALATYVAGLEARGFTVLTRSTTAASTVVALGDASYRVVLEQMSLPGEGVTLTVTVGRA